MINGIHHIAIIVSSEESVEFYSKLGFVEVFRKERERDVIVLMEGYGIQLEVTIDSSHPERATNPENIGLRHVALRVDKIEAVAEKLGLSVNSIGKDWIGTRYAYVYDPDGLPVELHE